jgi:spore coat protein U-like protein
MKRLFLCCLLLLCGCLAWAPSAHAEVICQTGIQAGTINFGDVDPSQSGPVDVTATINYSCQNDESQSEPLTLCFNIGYGSAGAAGDGNRQMAASGSSRLEFQLYRNAARTQIAGSIDEGAIPQPIQAQFTVPKRRGWTPGRLDGTVNVYARLPGSQASPVGSYSASFTPRLTGNIGFVNCQTDSYDDGESTMSPFTVTANIRPSCNSVTATDLSFGQSTGLLSANMDGTSTISLTCVNGTPYQVGLNNGTSANGNVRRMKFSGGGDYVTYELYRDSGRSQRWGNTQDTDTVAGTGSGSSQQIAVYGRVPPQTTPTPGTYADTVTVYVYY